MRSINNDYILLRASQQNKNSSQTKTLSKQNKNAKTSPNNEKKNSLCYTHINTAETVVDWDRIVLYVPLCLSPVDGEEDEEDEK